jgi:hypothetical protein
MIGAKLLKLAPECHRRVFSGPNGRIDRVYGAGGARFQARLPCSGAARYPSSIGLKPPKIIRFPSNGMSLNAAMPGSAIIFL